MKKKAFALSVAVSLVFSALAGCGSPSVQPNNAGGDEATKEGKPKVVVVLKTLSSQYWKFVEAGAKKAFQDFGVDGTVIGPASESQIMEQVNMLEDALSQNPSALVVAPTQPSTAIPVFQKYKEKKIPVLLIDTDAEWPDKTTFIGTDNLTAGKKAGELLSSMLKPGDKVALLAGALGNPAMDARVKGAREVLESKRMVVVAEQPADSDKAKAMAVMENILQTNPDLKGVYSSNDDMAIGALRALKAKGMNIPVIGTDGTIEAVEAIIAGDLVGSIAQSPYDMGYKGVENALKAIKGEKVEKRIDSGVDVITKENAQKKLEFLKSILQ
ncbi:sugar ABC transporter substrate-binding protein [Thermicanus aegyptius]|uniref:sugar ABC transporter substrate-binding protein n=1 Tax=Thermicanus aegyptius TaxID=94009 RepID=UPI0004196BA7|nr:substrate-binding domain-containing protein [Thermicanus aegyptius]